MQKKMIDRGAEAIKQYGKYGGKAKMRALLSRFYSFCIELPLNCKHIKFASLARFYFLCFKACVSYYYYAAIYRTAKLASLLPLGCKSEKTYIQINKKRMKWYRIWKWGIYMVWIYSGFIVPGSTVFDIGAYKGDFAKIFLALGAGKVVCVEPNPASIKILRNQLGNNKKVIIIEKAVGCSKGSSKFYICKKILAFSTCLQKHKELIVNNMKVLPSEWEECTVLFTTLDTLIKEFGKPAFCKIDIESSEPEALRGLSSKIDFISFEFREGYLDDAKLCISRILSLGKAKFNYYILKYKSPNPEFFDPYFRFKPRRWLTADQLLKELEALPDGSYGDIIAKIE